MTRNDHAATVRDASATLDDAPIALVNAATDGRCLDSNGAFRALFGPVTAAYNVLDDERILGLGATPHWQRAVAGDAQTLPVRWCAAARDPQAPDDRVALEVALRPVRDASGAVSSIAVWCSDVTRWQRFEDECRALRALFDAAPEAIIVSDARTGRIQDVNQRAAELFGYPRDAMLAFDHLALSSPDQPVGRPADAAIADFVARARRGESVDLEWTYRTSRGELLPCEILLAHVQEGGRVLCRVTILDLRERKRAEQERERVRALEEQNQRIHEANRLKSEFLAAMSHELRTPLNAIIGFSELMYDGSVAAGSPEHQEFVGDILTSSQHLLRLINGVLDLAKIEAGKLELHPQPIELDAVISEVIGLLRTQSKRKRIHVECELDPAVETVTIDPSRFRQVLYNYLSNALKFTPDGGVVAVRTRVEADTMFRLEVEDSGIGIAAAHLDQLFVEFAQLDAGARAPQGTGLGLALTRRLVEAQGGTVGVRSELGRGSVFFATLPRNALPSG